LEFSQEQKAREIALLEEVMKSSPSFLSAEFAEQMRNQQDFESATGCSRRNTMERKSVMVGEAL